MICKIRPRTVYGRTIYDPANETAVLLAKLAGVKTLDSERLRTIQDLGIEIEVEAHVVPFLKTGGEK